ncbi:MAG: hypothetical protein ABIQ02_12665 [Saprospiraceae bacterium]
MKISSLCFIVLAVTSLSCQRYLYKDYNKEKIKALYDVSLDRTSDINKENLASDLLSVSIDSSHLKWKYQSGRTYVLVAMWKKASDTMYYKNDCTTGYYNTRNRYNFVTVVPQLKNLCRENNFGVKEGVNLRLEQLLGLPAGSDKNYFVEAWVEPGNLIRPCRDTEITDRTCGRIETDSTSQEYKAYVNWLNTGNAGYPFTQLGYTYDWNKLKRSHEGLSEFLIDKQSNVIIQDFVETCDYCYVRKIKKHEITSRK